ncbi:hypothetical protein ACOMHN_024686 [Nucella lapillus]
MLHPKDLGPHLFANGLGINVTSALESNGTNFSSSNHNGRIDSAPSLKIGASKGSARDPGLPQIAGPAESKNVNLFPEPADNEGKDCETDSDCHPHAGWSIQQRPCSLASITTAAGRSTHCPGTLAFITAAAGWSTQRCPWTLALIIDIAAVS